MKPTRHPRTFIIQVGILLAISKMALSSPSEVGHPGTWMQWRGPHRNGTVDGAPWPNKLDTGHLQAIWRQEIGHGYSGPIVSVDWVFTVETRDKRHEIVRAFNRTSG